MKIKVDMSYLSKQTKEMMDSINNTMSSFGFNEKAILISSFDLPFTSNIALTRSQLNIIETTAQEKFDEKYGKGNFLIEDIIENN